MAKEILFHEKACRRLQVGVDKLTDTVRATLGPSGRGVVIQQNNGAAPLIVNDGLTIVKSIELEDPIENMGAKIIRQAAEATKEEAGDGITTTMILAHAISQEGFRNVVAGANPLALRDGIMRAAQLAVAGMDRLSHPVESKADTVRVGKISSGDATIGEMIGDAIDRVGKEGVVTVEESGLTETVLVVKNGLSYDKGYVLSELADSETGLAELEDPYILVTDKKIRDPQDLIPIMSKVMEQGKPLLVMAHELQGSALGLLVVNKRQGVLDSVAVFPPGFGEGRRNVMEDISIMTGGTYIDTEKFGYNLREITLDMLGRAKHVRVSKHSTVITGGAGEKEKVDGRISFLRAMIAKTDYAFEKKRYEERLAKLTGGVAVIRVGAFTDAEMKEKKLRMEDALHAARAAIKEGVVAGGGIAFLNVIPAVTAFADSLDGDIKTGVLIVAKALEAPARQIAENAGLEGREIVAALKKMPNGTGYDIANGAVIDMMKAGIIDPARVMKIAIRNAASAAATLLTSDTAVFDAKEN